MRIQNGDGQDSRRAEREEGQDPDRKSEARGSELADSQKETAGEEPERKVRLSISISAALAERLQELRSSGVAINVSAELESYLERFIDDAATPTEGLRRRIVERLRFERDSRRGVDWRHGRREGMRWARDIAAWTEITDYTRLTDAEVGVAVIDPEIPWLTFAGAFNAPLRDYGEDSQTKGGAPAFQGPSDPSEARSEQKWVYEPYRCEDYWRGWLTGVHQIHRLVAPDLDKSEPARSGQGPSDS